EPRAERITADLAECSADAGGIAGELDGRSVGQKFSLPGNGGLNESAKKVTDITNDEQREADGEDTDDDAAGVFIVAGRAHAHAAQRPDHTATDQPDDENTEDEGGQLDVEPHVAVEDVAELVADDALQLVAREFFERALGDRDDRIAGGQAGSEGIDAVFL